MRPCSQSSIRKFSAKNETGLLLACVSATVFLFACSLFAGASQITAAQVIAWLSGNNSDGQIHNILLYVRLPRSLAVLFCGAALALSGLLLQSALHNPLASAGTIGVNSGAGLFVVLSAIVFPGVFAAKPVFAFLGAISAALLVFAVSKKAGASKSAVIMAGVAAGSMLSAGTDAIITFRPESVMDKTAFFIGGFAQASLLPVLYTLPIIVVGMIGATLLSARMNVLSLGDEVAASLGLDVNRCRVLIIFCAALLAACAVCIGGLLGFVGLIVPHAARFLIGYDHKRLVPFTAMLGGGLVTGCDILVRLLFRPFEFPVGIVLSLMGAPFFLTLILRRKRISL